MELYKKKKIKKKKKKKENYCDNRKIRTSHEKMEATVVAGGFRTSHEIKWKLLW